MAAGSGSDRKKGSRAGSTEPLATRNRRDRKRRERRSSSQSRSDGDDDPDGLFESVKANGERSGLGNGAPEVEELVARFQRGGGELDVNELALSSEEGVELGMSGEDVEEEQEGGFVFDVNDQEEGDDEEVENYDDDEVEDGEDTGGKDLENLLWGHETRSGEGFDVSLEEQVELM